MKTIKKISVLLLLLCLAFIFNIIFINFGTIHVASANKGTVDELEQDEIYVSVEDSVDYFLSSLDVLRDTYVDELGNRFTANYCEYYSDILIYPGEKEGIYLDFDNSCGFAIITSNYTVLKLQLFGDYPSLRNQSEICYNLFTNSFVSNDSNVLSIDDNIDRNGDIYCKTPKYSVDTEGAIIDVDSYIEEVYFLEDYDCEIENYSENCVDLKYCEWDYTI